MELSRDDWKESLLDVIDFLRVEMIQFLVDEGRLRGRVKSYLNSMKDALSYATTTSDQETIEKYSYALGLIRSTLYSEFRRLGGRHLSPADRVIVIIRKLLELIGDDQDFRFYRSYRTLTKVIGNLFDNICMRGKNDGLWKLTDLVQSSMSSGRAGRFACNVLDLYHIEHPKPKTRTHETPETLLSSGGNAKEVSL